MCYFSVFYNDWISGHELELWHNPPHLSLVLVETESSSGLDIVISPVIQHIREQRIRCMKASVCRIAAQHRCHYSVLKIRGSKVFSQIHY